MTSRSVAIIDHVGLKAGMECYDLGLFHGLKDAGWKPEVYSNFTSRDDSENIFPVFHFRISENLFSFVSLVRNYCRLKYKIRKRRIKCCILHGFRFGFWEWILIRILKQPSVKLFLIVHDPESLIGNANTRIWMKKIFAMADRLIVHNNFVYEQLTTGLSPVEKGRISVIPHGNFIHDTMLVITSEPERQDSGPACGRKRLLFFGQIKETKGLDVLLEALALTDPSVELVIAGRMRRHSFKAYENLIKDLGIRNRVHLFIHYISPAVRNSLFQSADIVVLPYRKVYQSGVLLMAMSFGKTVIASDLPPNRELITNGQNGFLFEAGNKIELAKTIDYVTKNESIQKKVAENGFDFVKKQHSWSNIAKKWIRLFNS